LKCSPYERSVHKNSKLKDLTKRIFGVKKLIMRKNPTLWDKNLKEGLSSEVIFPIRKKT
jgi:hypothetical protein